jgi:hypothetical protein
MGKFSPPPVNFEGSVAEWQLLTARERFNINNPGRQKELDRLNKEKHKDHRQELRNQPVSKKRLKEYQELPATKKRRQERTFDNRDHIKKMQREYYANNSERLVRDKRKHRHKKAVEFYEMFGEGSGMGGS